MAVETQIPELSFAGNFPDIIVTSEDEVTIKLVEGSYIFTRFVVKDSANTENFTVGDQVTGETSGAEGILLYKRGEFPDYIIIGQTSVTNFNFNEYITNGSFSLGTTGDLDYEDFAGEPYPDYSELLAENYTPDTDGKVTIRLREFLERLLEIRIPSATNLYHQAEGYIQLTMQIDSEPPETFYVIKGGVQSLNVTDEEFIIGHFLTWQEPAKKVKENDPEWLTYFPFVPEEGGSGGVGGSVTIKAVAHYSDGSSQTKELHILTPNQLYSLNCNWEFMLSGFSPGPYKIDVYGVDTEESPVTNVQTFILSAESFQHEDIFLFANSIGGVDSIRFTGQLERVENFALDTAFYDREEREYFIDPQRTWTKNTGDFRSYYHLLWARDFFASPLRYRFYLGLLFRIIIDPRDLFSIRYELNNYTFRFRESEQITYQNFLELNPPDIQVIPEPEYVQTPEGEEVLTPEGFPLEFY